MKNPLCDTETFSVYNQIPPMPLFCALSAGLKDVESSVLYAHSPVVIKAGFSVGGVQCPFLIVNVRETAVGN